MTLEIIISKEEADKLVEGKKAYYTNFENSKRMILNYKERKYIKSGDNYRILLKLTKEEGK